MKMWKCPSELLVAIATHLHFSDKLSCSQVCREWNSVLKNTILLHRVEFSCSQKYKIFTERIKQNILVGSLVRKLILNTADLNWSDFRQIPVLFPRLEEFIWPSSRQLAYMFYHLNDDEEDNDSYDDNSRLSILQPWDQYLKKLDMFALQGFIPELFHTISLKNLTHLRLDYLGTTGPEYYYNHTIDALAEMPSLISLDLTTFQIDFKNFDRIHINAPNLIQLGLYHFQMSVYEDDYQNIADFRNIDRAVHLKTLNLYNWCEMSGPDFFWLEYFIYKYPNMEYLFMDSELDGYNFFEDIEDNDHLNVDYHAFDIKMLNLLNKCPIKKLGMLKQYLSPSILQKIETNHVELSGVSITTQPDLVCALPALRIMNSSHVYSFKQMFIDQLDPADWNYALMMNHLRKLDLVCQGESCSSLSLDLILIQCPLLEKIKLKSTLITSSTDEPEQDSIAIHKLKKLTLKDTLLDDHVFVYIAQCCPFLTSLHLENCRSTNNVTNIYLPNHNLYKLSIWKHSGPYYCRVITENTKGHYAIFGPPLALVTRNLDDELPGERIENNYSFDINFNCKSLTHLFVNHMQPY